MKRTHWTLLDLLAFPGLLMKEEGNANLHLRYICPLCPVERRKLREVSDGEGCHWNNEWSKGNYEIPKSFGVANFLSQYIFGRTDLRKYKKRD